MKIFVTGVNGLLGTNTILELLKNGYEVNGLIRNPSKFTLSGHKNLKLFRGDILDISSIEIAIKGCTNVIHIAAETRQNIISYNEYHKINVEGTRNILDAALKYKIKRMIFISTAGVFGFGKRDKPGDETMAIIKPNSQSNYIQSKKEAQDLVLSKQKELEVVIINPTFMIGPFDKKPGSDRIVLRGKGKKLIFYPPGGKNFIHVIDVAKAIVIGLEKGMNGKCYLLANENLTYEEFYRKVISRTKSNSVLIKIPAWVLICMGYIGNALKFFGIKNEFIMTNMKILCVNNFYSGKKVREAFNINFTPIDTAITDTLNWLDENKITG